MLKKQLHIHHTAEDRSLWPPLREKVTRPEQVAVLDAMQAEHARNDPQLDAVDQALAASGAGNLTRSVGALAEGLTGHMRHEENAALPLIETFLGPEGWDAFGRAIRKTQGLRAGPEYLPRVLDGAPIATQAKVLALLPPPVRLLIGWRGRRSTGGFPGGTATPGPAASRREASAVLPARRAGSC